MALNEVKRVAKSKRFYEVWYSMKDRCYNPKNHNYPRYGGRGIKVCERWHNYFNFEDDMYEEYVKHKKEYGVNNTSIDRYPNNDGDYEPSNTRWATYEEQNNNKSACHKKKVTINTIKQELQEIINQWFYLVSFPQIRKFAENNDYPFFVVLDYIKRHKNTAQFFEKFRNLYINIPQLDLTNLSLRKWCKNNLMYDKYQSIRTLKHDYGCTIEDAIKVFLIRRIDY